MELDLDRLDPEFAVILPALPPELANITRDNIEAVRAAMDARPSEPVESTVVITERSVPTPDGDVPVFVYRRPSQDVQPAVLWIHGGGYILGSAEDDSFASSPFRAPSPRSSSALTIS